MEDNNEEIRKYWIEKYWPELQKATFDSEDKLDTKIFAVCTGADGLLLGSMSFMKEQNYVYVAIVALFFFTLAMAINILYHKKAMKNHQEQFSLISDFAYSLDSTDNKIRKCIDDGNHKLDCMSTLSLIFILVGMISFAIYVILNI